MQQQKGPRGGLHGTRVRGCAEGLQRSNRSATATALREDGGENLRKQRRRNKRSRRRISDSCV